MKYFGFNYGHLIDAFAIIPSIDISWMTLKDGTYREIRFTWLFWFITFGQITNKLKEDGYY